MTMREFYTAVANADTLSTEIRDMASDALAKMDAKNAKRSSTPSKAAVENASLLPSVLAYLGTCTVAVPASMVAANCGLSSAPKAIAVLNLGVADGTVVVSKEKSTAKSGGKVNGYSLAKSE